MGNQLFLALVFLVSFISLLVFTELIYKRLEFKGEVTRKFAHFTATLSTVTFPYMFTDHWYVLALAVFFFILLYISKRRTQLKSIHDITRKSAGSYLLPAAVYLTFLISLKMGHRFYFILPVLVLAISDPVAGILGLNINKYNHKIVFMGYEFQKTTLGSSSFFLSSFLISVIALYYHRMIFDVKTFWLALIIALVGTLVELFSWRGLDNLFIPMSVLLLLVIFL
jgi:phytol kinase